MSAKNSTALILCGDGINCESETAHALSLAGFEPELVHVSQLLANSKKTDSASLIVFPGGFSFGDEIESGKVLAIKLLEKFKSELDSYIESGRLVVGICNGFQALVQMQLLPGKEFSEKKTVSLLANHSKRFINKWVSLSIPDKNATGYMKGLSNIELPIRHGEGRLSVSESEQKNIDAHCALKYDEDVNGSFNNIAALQNKTGNVLGMMPHPEAFIRWTHHPRWTTIKLEKPELFEKKEENNSPDGLKFWKNAFQMAKEL